MLYDSSNVFAKILRNELPCDKVYEDDHALAFHDINPLTPVHVLVIPKGQYVSMTDFGTRATAEEVSGFFKAVTLVAKQLGVNESGYRILANHGEDANQEVPHFHVHIFAGAPLGPMIKRIPT